MGLKGTHQQGKAWLLSRVVVPRVQVEEKPIMRQGAQAQGIMGLA